jgi:hypothetical protein
MKHGPRIAITTLAGLIISLFFNLPALAVPQLPSSFYGTVKVNNVNVPDGTSVQALIGGQIYASGLTQTYQGDSVYSLDVLSDDTDTPAQDGGREGDPVQFKIGGVQADQTGTWHSGSNVNLNLTASSSTPVSTPQATLTPVPTQTAIPTPRPTTVPDTSTPVTPAATTPVPSSPEPASTGLASSTPTSTQQSSRVPTQPAQPSHTPAKQKQPFQTPAAPSNPPGEVAADNSTLMISIILVVSAAFAGYLFLAFRKKK